MVRQPRGPPQQHPRDPTPKQEEEALVFAQNSDKKTPGTPKSDAGSKTSSLSGSASGGRKTRVIICKTCGQQGHASMVCPRKPPAQIHTTVATLPPDDASESSGDGDFTFQMMTQVAEPFVPTPGPRTYAEVLFKQHTTSPSDATILTQSATSLASTLRRMKKQAQSDGHDRFWVEFLPSPSSGRHPRFKLLHSTDLT